MLKPIIIYSPIRNTRDGYVHRNQSAQRRTTRRLLVPGLVRIASGMLFGLLILSMNIQFAVADQNSDPGHSRPVPPGLNWTDEIDVSQADSVDEAVEMVKNKLQQFGFEFPLTVNHQAAAKSVDLDLRPTQVIYATPFRRLTQRLLRRSKTIGIDLPLKFLVFEDESGEIQLRYNSVGYLIDRHNSRIRSEFGVLNYFYSAFGRPDNGLVAVPSTLDPESAIAGIKNAIQQIPAFRIPLELDFATRRGHVQKLIVFGNPNAGTPLMQADQNIALDLPQEMLVIGKRDGGSVIIYNDPFFIAGRYDIEGQDARLTAISGALANFAAAGSGN